MHVIHAAGLNHDGLIPAIAWCRKLWFYPTASIIGGPQLATTLQSQSLDLFIACQSLTRQIQNPQLKANQQPNLLSPMHHSFFSHFLLLIVGSNGSGASGIFTVIVFGSNACQHFSCMYSSDWEADRTAARRFSQRGCIKQFVGDMSAQEQNCRRKWIKPKRLHFINAV